MKETRPKQVNRTKTVKKTNIEPMIITTGENLTLGETWTLSTNFDFSAKSYLIL